jgi:hypothetical protein
MLGLQIGFVLASFFTAYPYFTLLNTAARVFSLSQPGRQLYDFACKIGAKKNLT